ncbi:MAG: hypothetical protein HY709_10835 [Candidatus Latescibacteria bacterium]|nr:hypothetical protein [Candidatus Latescibacterota bacterium]
MSKLLKTVVLLSCSVLFVGCYTMIRGPKPTAIGADQPSGKVKKVEQTKLIKDEEKVAAVEGDEETVYLRDSERDRYLDFYDPLRPSLRNPRSYGQGYSDPYGRGYYDPYTGLYYDPYTGAPIPYDQYGGMGPYGYGYDPYSGYPVTGFVWTDDSNTSKKTENPSEAVTTGPGTSAAQTATTVPETKRPAARNWGRQHGLLGQPYGAGSPSSPRGGSATASRPTGSTGSSKPAAPAQARDSSGTRSRGGRVK